MRFPESELRVAGENRAPAPNRDGAGTSETSVAPRYLFTRKFTTS